MELSMNTSSNSPDWKSDAHDVNLDICVTRSFLGSLRLCMGASFMHDLMSEDVLNASLTPIGRAACILATKKLAQ